MCRLRTGATVPIPLVPSISGSLPARAHASRARSGQGGSSTSGIPTPRRREWMLKSARNPTALGRLRLRDVWPAYRILRLSVFLTARPWAREPPPLCARVRPRLSTGAVGPLTPCRRRFDRWTVTAGSTPRNDGRTQRGIRRVRQLTRLLHKLWHVIVTRTPTFRVANASQNSPCSIRPCHDCRPIASVAYPHRR